MADLATCNRWGETSTAYIDGDKSRTNTRALKSRNAGVGSVRNEGPLNAAMKSATTNTTITEAERVLVGDSPLTSEGKSAGSTNRRHRDSPLMLRKKTNAVISVGNSSHQTLGLRK